VKGLQPVYKLTLEQILPSRDCDPRKTHDRAQEKSEKEGAAERNC